MVRDLNRVSEAFGSYEKQPLDIESPAIGKMGKSIVLKRSLKKGFTLKKDNICFKSPGTGIPPSEIESVLDRTLKCDVNEEQILKREHFE